MDGEKETLLERTRLSWMLIAKKEQTQKEKQMRQALLHMRFHNCKEKVHAESVSVSLNSLPRNMSNTLFYF